MTFKVPTKFAISADYEHIDEFHLSTICSIT